MSFKRAITKEQRDMQREIIVSEALKLFMNEGFDSVTFHRISKKTGFSRSVLYSLYESPADILLECLNHKYRDIYQVLSSEQDSDIDVMYRLIALIDLDPGFKALGASLSTILEPHASMDTVLKYKRSNTETQALLAEYIQTNSTEVFETSISSYLKSVTILYVGTTNYNPTDTRVKKINKTIRLNFEPLSFSEVWLRIFGARFIDQKGHEYLKQISKEVHATQFKDD